MSQTESRPIPIALKKVNPMNDKSSCLFQYSEKYSSRICP